METEQTRALRPGLADAPVDQQPGGDQTPPDIRAEWRKKLEGIASGCLDDARETLDAGGDCIGLVAGSLQNFEHAARLIRDLGAPKPEPTGIFES
jgi:hypothetical protein